MRERRLRVSALARRAALATMLAALAARPARTQTQNEPLLVFSIYGGLSEASPLWSVPIQPLPAPNGQADTVGLARRLRPGLVAGLVTTYFASPHFGWSADIAYFGFGSEEVCNPPLTWAPDSQSENEQICTSANGQHVGTNVVGLLAGATWRPIASGALQPFVRVTAGPGLLGNTSFFETSGFALLSGGCATGCTVTILRDTENKELTWVVNVAAGTTLHIAPGYAVRMEARDIITRLPVATGPRDPVTGVPPSSSVVKHLPTLLFGLDIMLERRHPRRY